MDVGWTPRTYGGEKLYILNSDNYASWLLIGWWWVSRQNICQLILRIWDFRRFQIVRTADTKLSLHTSKCEKQVSSHLGSWHDFHQQPEVLISSFKHIYINVVVEIKTSISKTANFSYRILSLKSVLKRPIIYQVNLKLYLLGCWQKFHLWQLKVANCKCSGEMWSHYNKTEEFLIIIFYDDETLPREGFLTFCRLFARCGTGEWAVSVLFCNIYCWEKFHLSSANELSLLHNNNTLS